MLRTPDQRGQVVVLVGILLAALLLGMGLAVDVGQLEAARRAGQVAADAGAWAGAVRLYKSGTPAQAIAAATADVTTNGFSTGAPAGTTVTVSSPPASGAFAGNASYVQVIVTQSVGTTFFRSVQASTPVTTTAVAGVRGCAGTVTGVLVLDTGSIASAIDMINTDIVVNGAGVQVNSSSASSVVFGATGSATATSFKMTGDASVTNKAKISPTPLIGQPTELASGASPLACLDSNKPGGLATFAGVDINGAAQSTTISQGIYTNGFRIRSGATLTLNPGIYVLKGGNGLTISGASSIVAPSGGVMIYNTNASFPAAGGACGPISMAGTGTVNLSAPKTGSYAGLLLWDDSVCAPDQAMTVTAGWTAFTGTVYLPSAGNRLTITQSASRALDAQLIVNRLSVTGNFTLTLNFDPLKVYGHPALVE